MKLLLAAGLLTACILEVTAAAPISKVTKLAEEQVRTAFLRAGPSF
jgi:hypothetical protein